MTSQLKTRYTARAKVTGKAKFVAEFKSPFPKEELLYAYMVQSTIPNGTLGAIDSTAAQRSSGVIAVLTPFNAPRLAVPAPKPPARRNLTLLQDTDISYNGQPIAVVIAKSLVEAKYGASQLKIKYNQQPAQLDFTGRLAEARWPKLANREPSSNHRGDVAAGFARAAVIVDEAYTTPIQNHNPMEPHATIAWWDEDQLNLYDSTQYIVGVTQTIARLFALPLDAVRVQCPYTGGGFGSKGRVWSHVSLCAMAAMVVGKPVKLVLDREQMFGPVGGRPATFNRIKLGATADGRLTAMQHDVVMHTSVLDDYIENASGPTRMLYACPNNAVSAKMVEVNLGVCTFMRAPGHASGTAVLEVAMDELAEKLKMDPLQLRLVNYAEIDPSYDRPFTSKNLRACYAQAADRFGWTKRNPVPGSIVEGNDLIGMGMGTAVYPAHRSAAQAVVRMSAGGKVMAGSATQDLGTGMYTMIAQTAAAALDMDPALVEVKLGDSRLPKAPVAGGSQSTASVTPAVRDAAQQLILKLAELAVHDGASPLFGMKTIDVTVSGGRIMSKAAPEKSESLAILLARHGDRPVEAIGSAEPGEDSSAFTSQSFGVVFAEVAVDRDTRMVKVRRVVATFDIGTLMSDVTGINQLVGGIVWGVSFALYEQAHIDPVYGRTVNENIAEYHVPVNADIGTIDVTCLNIPDLKFNPLGARGIGEIGNTGSAAAVANAIYNATGKRVRDYPITPDKLMA